MSQYLSRTGWRAVLCAAVMVGATALAGNVSRGAIVTQSYTSWAQGVLESLREVSELLKLTNEDHKIAVEAAALHVYVGVCEGDTRALDKQISPVGLVAADTKRTLDVASLAMAAAITRTSLGRKGEYPCRFALEIGNPMTRDRK